MTAPIAGRAASAGRSRRIALTATGLAVLLLVGGYFGGRAWVQSYLRSDEFRQFVARRVGQTLHAQAEFAPFTFTGLNAYSNEAKARGFEDAPFAEAQLGQVRAELSLRRFFEKVWQIERLEAETLTLRLEGTRLARESAPKSAAAREPAPFSGWLPNRVEVGSATVRELNIEWGDSPASAGAVRGLELRAVPASGGWNFTGSGGQLASAGMPTLEVGAVTLRQSGQSLFIQGADFTQAGGGSAHLTGEVLFGERVDLQVQLAAIDLTPHLRGDWRARLHGKVAGDVRVQSRLPSDGSPELSGTLRIENGHVEALPVLEQIDRFTGSKDFRRVALTRASGDFARDATRLRVTNFVAESQGLLRVEGEFTVMAGQIDGSFQVGVAPSRLQWLPGSQERVFTISRDGYVWAPMRLTGPAEAPQEDLSPRLLTAAQDVVAEKVESTARDAIRTGKDAAKSALDLLMPLFK